MPLILVEILVTLALSAACLVGASKIIDHNRINKDKKRIRE